MLSRLLVASASRGGGLLQLQHAAPGLLLQLDQQHQQLAGAVKQQQQWHPHPHFLLQQQRGKSTAAAADAQQAAATSSGWSWFGSSTATTAAASPSPPPPLLPDDAAAAAAPSMQPPAAAFAQAGDPAAAAAAASTAVQPAELIGHADAIMDVTGAAADAMVAAAQASVWPPTRLFMEVMLTTHDWIGVPWFEAILISNVIIKAAAFPLALLQQRMTPVMAEMKADTQKLQVLSNAAAKATTAGEYAMHTEALTQGYAAFNAKFRGKKRWTFLMPLFGLSQALVLISQFGAISALASHKVPSMTYEGALWFSNLTAPDPIMLLPVICAATTLAQVHTKRFQDQLVSAGPSGALMKPLMTGMSGVILLVGYFQPSAIALLWTINSVLTMGQNALLAQPGFRSLCGLPPVAAPAAPGAAAAGGGQPAGQSIWQVLKDPLGQGTSSSSSTPKPAAAVGAPPPGTPMAVNYVSNKPSKRRIKV